LSSLVLTSDFSDHYKVVSATIIHKVDNNIWIDTYIAFHTAIRSVLSTAFTVV